ncbi:MAG: hypothetical protein AB1295_04250 [Candidatus Micrarchaeota archaeon]
MSDFFAVRNLDEKTKREIQAYAEDKDVSIAEAIRDLVFYGLQHMKHTRKGKKYSSFRDVFDKLRFKGGRELSQQVDEVVYG